MSGGAPWAPQASAGGMVSRRLPPTFRPGTPMSQPCNKNRRYDAKHTGKWQYKVIQKAVLRRWSRHLYGRSGADLLVEEAPAASFKKSKTKSCSWIQTSVQFMKINEIQTRILLMNFFKAQNDKFLCLRPELMSEPPEADLFCVEPEPVPNQFGRSRN